MADITMKQSDTRPALAITLTAGGTAINLTTATSVRFLMRLQGTTTGGISRTASVTSAAAGTISVTLQSADTATVGLYDAEVEITWNDSGIETVPNDGYLSVQIVDDLA